MPLDTEIYRSDYEEIPKGESPGVPVVRVFATFKRFQGYTLPGELYWTVQSEFSQDGSSSATLSPTVQNNQKKGYIAPATRYFDRANYIKGLKYDNPEKPIYADSNAKLEQSWRTWLRQPNPPFSYINEDAVEPTPPTTTPPPPTTPAPTPSSTTPAPTPPPKPKSGEPPAVTEGTYDDGYIGTQYEYTFFDPETKAQSKERTDLQVIQQSQAGPYSGTLKQEAAFPASTELRFKVYAYKPKDIHKSHLPVTVINIDADLKESVKEVSGLEGPFLMLEFGRETSNNIYIVFPYDQTPFMFHASLPSARKHAPSNNFIISEDKKIIEFSISDNRSRVLVEHLDTGEIWEFPTPGIVKQLEKHKISEKLRNGSYNTEEAYYLPAVPIFLHHCGIKFGFNICPAEYPYGDVLSSEEQENFNSLLLTSPGLAANDLLTRGMNIFVSPPIHYTSEQQILPTAQGQDLSITDFPLVPTNLSQVGADMAPGTLAAGGFTRSGISLQQSANFYIIPNDPLVASLFSSGGASQNFGLSVYNDTEVGDVSIYSYRVMAIINGVKPLSPFSPSAAYFKPKIYGIRTIAHTTYMPNDGLEWDYELSSYLQKLSVSKNHDSYTFIRTSADMEFYVPQPYERYIHQHTPGDTDIPRRFDDDDGEVMSWEKLMTNPAWIKLHYFWHGNSPSNNFRNHSNRSKANFIGMTDPSRSFEDSADKTTLKIHAVDLIGVLEQSLIFNSPFYDGMSVPYAVASILERAGFKARDFDSFSGQLIVETQSDKDTWFYVSDSLSESGLNLGQSTFNFTLPYSGLFTQPLLQFQAGTKVSDAIKRICQMFKIIFYTDRQGKFVLSIMPGNQFSFFGAPVSLYSETNSIPPSDSFYSMYDRGDDIMKFTFDSKSTEIPAGKGWGNIFHVMTIDKFTGNLIGVTKTIPESIFDTTARNFKGMITTYFSQKSALGGRDEANLFLDNFTRILSQPTREVGFKVRGQDHLYPLEIVQIDENNIRINDISHEFILTKEQRSWWTKINGFHFGSWNSDVNPHDPDYDYQTDLEVS